MSDGGGHRAGAVLVSLGVLLAGCSGGELSDAAPASPGSPVSSAASATAAPEPPVATEAPRPEAGACHRLDFEEALAPTANPSTAPCRAPHTAETFAVGRVDDVVDGHLLAIDSERVQRQVATACPAALPAAVGGTLEDVRLSMLRAVWFTPTVEESDAGADWYRCDVVVLAGRERLRSVRGSLEDALASPEGRATYGMCGTARPDEPGFERVPCAEQHTWRAISVVTLPSGDYPGREAIAAAGQAPCEDAGAAAADDPLDYAWAFEGPDRDQWAAGQTFLRCWAPA